MSMMCCQRCATPIDTDFNVEVCRYGFKMHGGGLIKTNDENDVATLCDNCFEGYGYEDDIFDQPTHSRAELEQMETDELMERLAQEQAFDMLDQVWVDEPEDE
jgi:hypothetical protein